MTSRHLPYLAKVGILGALYFAGGKLGLLLAVPQGNVTLVWPPTGSSGRRGWGMKAPLLNHSRHG